MPDNNRTLSDMWPNPEDMPANLKSMMQKVQDDTEAKVARIQANPKHISKTWYQVDTSAGGVVTCVWVNKPCGKDAGLWTFEPSISNDGARILRVVKAVNVDELMACPVREWTGSYELGDFELMYALAWLVGLRTARGVVSRLRGVNVSVQAENREVARRLAARRDGDASQSAAEENAA
jgi:hypothetical protein